jgi:hypothetical protein
VIDFRQRWLEVSLHVHSPDRSSHGANRRDSKFIDSAGLSSGQFSRWGTSAEQIATWRILVRVLQARYGIPDQRIYAHPRAPDLQA